MKLSKLPKGAEGETSTRGLGMRPDSWKFSNGSESELMARGLATCDCSGKMLKPLSQPGLTIGLDIRSMLELALRLPK